MLTAKDIVGLLIVLPGVAIIIYAIVNWSRNVKQCQQIQEENAAQLERQRLLQDREEALLTRIERLVERFERD